MLPDQRRLTYEDGYREGRASAFAGAAAALVRKSHEINEPPSRVSVLLEALVVALREIHEANVALEPTLTTSAAPLPTGARGDFHRSEEG